MPRVRTVAAEPTGITDYRIVGFRMEEMSVVDSELRVHGLDGLRVADASVIPSVPCGSPAATVYALSERAADLIRHP